jgi:putative ABC transport system permease protein
VGSRLTILTNTVHGSYNGVDVTVTGIFHSGLKDLDDSYFRIQRSLAAKLLDTDKVESIAIGLSDDRMWDSFAKFAGEKLPELSATPFAVLDKVYYQHSVDWLGQQFMVILMIIVLIVLLGITNTVSFTVLERSQEIGNLRANGESAHEVLLLLLWEGALVGILGAALGILVSYFINIVIIPNGILMPPAPGLTRQFYVKVELRAVWVAISSALGITVALMATLLAGWRQVRQPIAALLRQR